MMTFPLPPGAQRGQSLIQVLVALAIGLVLLVGVGQIFLASKQTYTANDALARVQENGRFANDFLANDIRHAGFLGCDAAQYPAVNNLVDPSRLDDDAEAVLEGIRDEAIRGFSVNNALPADLVRLGLGQDDVVAGTDAVLIRRARACEGGRVSQPMGSDNNPIPVEDAQACDFDQGAVLLITDCRRADLFRRTDDASGTGSGQDNLITVGGGLNTSPRLSRAYNEDAFVYRFDASLFYIGVNDRDAPSLYRRRLVGGSMISEELVESVEDLAIEYGVDTNGNRAADDYRHADDVGNWDNVVSVRYSLVGRSSEDLVTDAPQVFEFDGATVESGDRRLRRVFGSTAAIRNRLP